MNKLLGRIKSIRPRQLILPLVAVYWVYMLAGGQTSEIIADIALVAVAAFFLYRLVTLPKQTIYTRNSKIRQAVFSVALIGFIILTLLHVQTLSFVLLGIGLVALSIDSFFLLRDSRRLMDEVKRNPQNLPSGK